jgi:hypothetical protein
LFWGDDDRVIPITHALEAVPIIDGVSVKRFPGCGHYPHLEQPEQFAAALEAFLDAPPGYESPLDVLDLAAAGGAFNTPPRV